MPTTRSARGALLWALSTALLLSSCGESVHQVVLVVDTSLCKPGDGDAPDFDRVTVSIEGSDPLCAVFGEADGECVSVTAADFPLVLPVVSASGTGTVSATVELHDGGELVGCATGSVDFETDQTRYARIDVERPCGAPSCVDGLSMLPDDTDVDALEGRTCSAPSPQPQEPIIRIAAGSRHACMVDERGDMFCWGRNNAGQLGTREDVETRPRPGLVQLPTGFVTDADGGDAHTCAVVLDGENSNVWCWGLGDDGQLGNGMTASTANPVVVQGSGNAEGVALGPFHGCASFAPDGHVSCWGSNERGEVDGSPGSQQTRLTAVPLPNDPSSGMPGAVAVAAGGSNVDPVRHSCANTTHGVYCWGDDSVGQLGRPSDGPEVAVVEALAAVTQLAAGTRDTCAVDDAGQIFCWGTTSTASSTRRVASRASAATPASGSAPPGRAPSPRARSICRRACRSSRSSRAATSRAPSRPTGATRTAGETTSTASSDGARPAARVSRSRSRAAASEPYSGDRR
jgi:hypothetical protein